MLSQLGQVTVQFADNMMVGRVGTTELAAASFANSVFVIGMLFATGISMGLTPLVGKAFLKKDGKQIVNYLKNGTILYILIGVLAACVLTVLSFLLHKMGQTAEVARLAQPYMWVLIISLLPLMVFSSFKQFLEGMGNTKIAMIITVGSNFVNISLNYLLIYGKCGFPELGLLGAGVSTMIARFIMAFAIVICFNVSEKLRYLLQKAYCIPPRISEMIALLKIGVPIGVQVIFEVLIFSLSGIMMGWIGEKALAAHQITLSMTTLSYMISLGIGSAATIRVSHAMGANDVSRIKRLIHATAHLTVGLMGTMGIVFIICRHQLPMLFTNDSKVILISANLFIIAAMFQIFDSLQVALLASLRGLTDVNIPMVMAVISYLFIGIPTCYLFAFTLNFGPIGIWFGLLCGLAVAAILFALRLRFKVKQLEQR